LRTLPTGNIFDPILYLTDGTVTEDQDGNQTQKIYTWDDALWIPALTMTDSNTNVIITPAANTYSIIPSTGQVILSTFPTGTFDNNSLKVVLTKVG
ncbi:hypothetical protein, partial [Salmonella enterica]|uniref:hypothetical protein n=1 Tax=Salmonella enterica TaxID=28901 RepID=UPI003D2E85CA